MIFDRRCTGSRKLTKVVDSDGDRVGIMWT